MPQSPQDPSDRSKPVPSIMRIHERTAEHRAFIQRLRTSEEIAGHKEKLAIWIYNTSPQYFNSIFGDADYARQNLEKWVCRDNSEFSGKFCYLLRMEGVSAGCLIAIPGAEVANRRRADTLTLIKNCSSTNRLILQTHLAGLQAALAPVMNDELYIRCISIDPAYRGRGLGRILLQDVITHSKSLGTNKFRLDVEADNASAIGLYRKLGFTVTHSGRFSLPEMVVYSMTLIFKSA